MSLVEVESPQLRESAAHSVLELQKLGKEIWERAPETLKAGCV